MHDSNLVDFVADGYLVDFVADGYLVCGCNVQKWCSR